MSDLPKGHPLERVLIWLVGGAAVLTAVETLIDELIRLLPKLALLLILILLGLAAWRRWQSKNSW